MILEIKNIHKFYRTGAANQLDVLKGISLSINSGEIISIVGQSGAGKSTLVHILGLLDRPSSGEIIFEEKNVTNLTDEQISRIRNLNIGFVFQFHHLLPEFTALENVMMPAMIAGKNGKDEIAKAKSLLNEVGLEEREHHRPSELSGGEQQRVAVARALMNSPKIIFADEPSGNLDAENAEKLHDLLFNLRTKYNQTFVIVTHNKDLAKRSDRVISLSNGMVV